MAITNFISTIWSENLYRELDKQYIAVSHCSRDFEGDIKNVGSTVKICGVGAVGVSDYTKNTDMSTPQDLSDTVTTLKIDRAKYFNFQIDDIDRAQSTPKLMEAAMSIAASALANETDKYIFSLFSEAQSNVCCENVTPENILDNIIMARQKLYENNVLDASDIVIEVSPQIASVILRAKIDLSTDNSASLEAGYLGSIAGCKIYVSNNIKQEELSDSFHHMCFVRTKRAIAFAEQLSEIEAYRPEKRFADAVKGLHLYGAKVVYPQELVCLELGLPIVIE
jgi:hypothetical protein